MIRIACLIACLIAGLAGPAVAGPDGRVRIIDGDTAEIGGVTVRLHGIDAPEVAQACGDVACGRWAADVARALFEGRRATCRAIERDRYGRVVARCEVGGTDMGEALVGRGAAMAYRRYSMDYLDAEKQAMTAGEGLWAWDTTAPWDWRRTGGAPAAAAPVEGCAIKGNVSGNGRIYHMPGQADYARTRIDEGRGERWFCTEAEARAAGWRRARR